MHLVWKNDFGLICKILVSKMQILVSVKPLTNDVEVESQSKVSHLAIFSNAMAPIRDSYSLIHANTAKDARIRVWFCFKVRVYARIGSETTIYAFFENPDALSRLLRPSKHT